MLSVQVLEGQGSDLRPAPRDTQIFSERVLVLLLRHLTLGWAPMEQDSGPKSRGARVHWGRGAGGWTRGGTRPRPPGQGATGWRQPRSPGNESLEPAPGITQPLTAASGDNFPIWKRASAVLCTLGPCSSGCPAHVHADSPPTVPSCQHLHSCDLAPQTLVLFGIQSQALRTGLSEPCRPRHVAIIHQPSL